MFQKGNEIMTFFNDFKRNASTAANKAAKKTNELTAIAKLNLGIKSCESKLNTVYGEIGRLFYTATRSGEDYSSDISNLVLEADKYTADINSLKAQLNDLRKVTVCTACGNEIPNDAFFCPICGAKQEKPAEEPCCCECCKEAAEETSECGCCEEECTCECCEEAAEECTCECCEENKEDAE